MKTITKSFSSLCAVFFLSASSLFGAPTIATFSATGPTEGALDVMVQVGSLGEGENSLTLYLGEATPRDGDPAQRMEAVETLPITSAGTYSFLPQITYGTHLACKVVLTDGQGQTAESGVVALDATDHFGYSYIGTGSGNWHDPANWQVAGNDQGYKCAGYPAYTTGWVNMGNGTKTVHVDAEYSVREFHINQAALNLTLIGDSNNAMILVTDGVFTAGNTITYDHIRLYSNSYTIPANGKQYLLNGADLNVKWEINVNGDNAYLYIGPGSIAQTKRDWWWTFRIDGQGALVEIDNGTLYTRGLRFGANNGSAVPLGIVMKGSSPLLKIDEELVVVNPIPGSPTIEFFVPYNGYAQPPVQKVGNNAQFPMCGYTWQDHNSITSTNIPPVLFKISPRSPFFTQLDTADFLLVDWSRNQTPSIYINEPGIAVADFENPGDNRFHLESSFGGSVHDQMWVSLTGTGIPFSRTEVESAVSSSVSGNQLDVSTSVADLGEGSATATLWVGISGPNGNPITNMSACASASISDLGTLTLGTTVPLGAQVAYAILCENIQGSRTYTSSTVTNILHVTDGAAYVWTSPEPGLWSDPANWSNNANDGALRLGYPSYGSRFQIHNTPSNVLYVDGAYTGMQGNCCLGWGGATTSLIGITPDAEIECGGFECYDNVHTTIDGVKVRGVGSYHVFNNSSMHLLNGTSFSTRWEYAVNGANALLHVGTNCTLSVSTAEPFHRLSLAGDNARIEIDNGKIEALFLWIGNDKTDQTPDGIYFSGPQAQLTLRGTMNYPQGIINPLPGSPVLSFSIPVEGFETTPIRRTGASGNPVHLFANVNADGQPTEGIPPIRVHIDPQSPFFNESSSLHQPLIDWSADAKGHIVTENVILDSSIDSVYLSYYYTPQEDPLKQGLSIHAKGRGFTLLLLR